MALLIFGWRQYQSLVSGMSNSSDSRASCFVSFSSIRLKKSSAFGVSRCGNTKWMNRIVLVILLLLFPLLVVAQTADEIRKSKDYLWGEGWGETTREADRQALQSLVEKISVNVESSFTNVEQEVTTNGEIDAISAVKSVIKTYSQATLTNTEQIVILQEPDAQVLRYVRRNEVNQIFEGRKNKVMDMLALAGRAESKLKIDDALRYYYWSYCLLRSLPNANMITRKDDGSTLMTWIPDRMNEVLSGVKVQKIKEEGEFVTLRVTYNGNPVASLDYTYFDGRGYTNIYGATDGLGVMELQQGASTDNLKIKCEYEYLGESQIDKEIATVVEVMKGRNFRGAYIKVDDNNTIKPDVASPSADIVGEAVSNMDLGRFSENETDYYENVMRAVISCIRNNDYAAAEPYFTDEGKEMFVRLLAYGNARIIEEPKLSYLHMGDEVLCRSIPICFSFRNNTRRFVEKVTFAFGADRKINCVAFGLGEEATADILKHTSYSEQARVVLTRFLENYKTAFALKRLDYIRSIFDDNALIITGTAVKASAYKNVEEQKRFMDNKIIRYNRYSKNEYMKHLEHCFNSNEYVNIRFANNDIVKANESYGEVYGIQIKQDYYSTNYGDTGYLFLYVDLNDSDNPVIKVRTWQPERDPNFGLYGLGDF